MKRSIIVTSDGSHSISIPEMNVTYHSTHGAIQESMHVFINAGLHQLINQLTNKPINIFEVGFGTGLNALLTLIESEKSNQKIIYETVEPFPISIEEVRQLNYCEILNRKELQPLFEKLHNYEWEKEIEITNDFVFRKSHTELQNYRTSELQNLIYFDAFDPNVQTELWTKENFEKMFSMLEPGGILVTYSSKGAVRRAMQDAGFMVKKIPGPMGKREITRANKK